VGCGGVAAKNTGSFATAEEREQMEAIRKRCRDRDEEALARKAHR